MSPKQINAARRQCASRVAGIGHKRGSLWQASRILREFTCAELAAVTEQENLQSIRTYIGQLAKAKYIVRINSPLGKLPRRYRLVRNTGPLPPHLMKNRTVFYDPNTKEEFNYV